MRKHLCPWVSESEWVWVSRESDAGQRKRLTSSTHPLVLPTCWLLVSWVTICFGPSASLLSSHSLAQNGSYLKTKQSNDAFRQKEENWRGEKKVSAELRDRQADCEKKKNKTLKGKTRAPLLVGLPFLLATVATNWRSGRGTSSEVKGEASHVACVWMCVYVHLVKKSIFTSVFFSPSSYIRGTYLCIPVHVKQHIQTADVCVSLVGPCVHLGGGRLCLVGTSCTAFQEWEFLRGLCLSSNSLLYKYRL